VGQKTNNGGNGTSGRVKQSKAEGKAQKGKWAVSEKRSRCKKGAQTRTGSEQRAKGVGGGVWGGWGRKRKRNVQSPKTRKRVIGTEAKRVESQTLKQEEAKLEPGKQNQDDENLGR